MKIRAIGIVSIILFSMVNFWAVGQESTPDQLLESVDEVLEKVIAIRGLEPKSSIERGIESKAQIREFLLAKAKEEYPQSEVEAEGEMLKMLGLIPEELDLYNFMLDLLTEQIAGYYDPEQKKLIIADWLPVEIQKPVLAHEVLHAIQDQHFNLSKYLEREEDNDDAYLARTALIEGEGFIVMLAYSLKNMGLTYEDIPDVVALSESQMPMMEAQYEVFASAPRYLKETLMFPYSYGGNFVLRLLRENSWSELSRVYESPPDSSEQILHPSKFEEERDAPELEIPVILEDDEGDLIYENVLGEFSLRQVLAEFLEREVAEKAAAGWDGDSIRLLESSEGKKTLRIDSIWDSPEDADQFLNAYCDLLELKYGRSRSADSPENLDCSVSTEEVHSGAGRQDRLVGIIERER